MERTAYNGELRLKDVGKTVSLVGWVSTRRNLGAIEFIDLRDNTGLVQLTIQDSSKVPDVRNEYVIAVTGVVGKKAVPNPKLPSGEVEVIVSSLQVINASENPPFIIADKTDALEDIRLQYRYLDLRRPQMLENLRTRAKIVRLTHEYLDANRFLEVETPILNIATPEGARDYLVPSRIRHGSFYALPQSPQLFKQLLMIGGVERYYQIARCFRDEDLRADRQPEFTQIDVETSFLDQDQILSLAEGMIAKYFKEILNYDVKLPLRRLDYWEGMDKYGSDKPDTRYELYLHDLTAVLSKSAFEGFKGARYIKGLVIPGYAEKTSRKTLDELQLEARKFNLKGVLSLKMANGALEGSFIKFLNADTEKELIASSGLKNGDLLLFASSSYRRDIDFGLGALRIRYAKEMGLVKPNTYDLLWVINFPMFDKIEGTENQYTAEHHPFTRPRDEDLPLLDTDPEKVWPTLTISSSMATKPAGEPSAFTITTPNGRSSAYWALSEEEVAHKFGWFIDAFKYGVPPHGGFALGLDRLAMILTGTDNIRDVEAFPKNLQAVDPMSHAPARRGARGVGPSRHLNSRRSKDTTLVV
jgi:aspartyl-tRNA synthetase